MSRCSLCCLQTMSRDLTTLPLPHTLPGRKCPKPQQWGDCKYTGMGCPRSPQPLEHGRPHLRHGAQSQPVCSRHSAASGPSWPRTPLRSARKRPTVLHCPPQRLRRLLAICNDLTKSKPSSGPFHLPALLVSLPKLYFLSELSFCKFLTPLCCP